ncbi:HlyD family type I secretion periplasmic adaptor subunit [Sphingomonas sp. Leaf343]|uniref:HlyD family type I secretion periplasmic adaptor subunit n=1 Tax=Sphingomonas sp. Leaf343 TaxID=1736345 RepID=UPI000A43A8F5|nr:HlyD family type I secretion periplasmic adaptor subunit [Sphingomonas sp. Leaf343]
MSSLSDQMIAAHARLSDPRRDIRTGGIVAALFFVLFLGWAAVARLDAAAHASGQLVVSGQRQSVQHRDGGVVAAILVQEAQRVRRGQLLIRLAAPDVEAQERILAAQAIRLWAQRARLLAEQAGASQVATPPEFASLAEQDRPLAAETLAMQQRELVARRATLGAQRGALGSRAQQSVQQGRGYARQSDAAREQLRLIDDQIRALSPLADKGFVSQTRLRELERQRAGLRGQDGQYIAGVAQSGDAMREMQLQSLEAQQTYRERTAAELRDAEDKLGDVLPKLAAARDQVARTEIRAPASGAVVGLTVFTPGGVVAPGQKLMDIVPEAAPMVVQAKVQPDDADDLHVGQTTRVRFPSLHERDLPDLEGVLTRLSADSFTDERSSQHYYTAEIRIPPEQLAIVRRARGDDFAFRAGMPAEVLVPLRRRTALQYMIEPLVGSFWGAFGEH